MQCIPAHNKLSLSLTCEEAAGSRIVEPLEHIATDARYVMHLGGR
jgi:hypothetical protein